MAKARKTATQAQANFVNRVQVSAQAYKDGVTNPSVDWANAATAPTAVNRRNAGLQAAMNNGTIDEGIQRVGNAKWRNNASTKGATAWPTQTAAAGPTYGAGMTRVQQEAWPQADQAVASIDTSTAAGRRQKMVTWSETIHNWARANKGLPPD